MKNKKQTAVDWVRRVVVPLSGKLTPQEIETMFGVAKLMEKEQIIDAFDACVDGGFFTEPNENYREAVEKYYEKTYV